MKLRKVFVGMAASSLAVSMFAMSASAFKAGLYYQSDGTWDFRNAYAAAPEDDLVKATFPNAGVGVQGGKYGIDTTVTFSDVDITEDGEYTVSGKVSGTINEQIQVYDDGTERSGGALNWSVAKNFEMENGEVIDGQAFTGFNLIGLTTDAENFEVDDDGNVYLDGKKIKFSDVTIKYGANTYTVADPITDATSDSLNFTITNKWNKEYKDFVAGGQMIDHDTYAAPGADDVIELTFTVTGLSESAGGDSSTPSGESSKAGDDSSKKADESSKADASSKAADAGTSKAASNGGTAAAGSTAAGGGSDATSTTAATGATAGLVFAGIALAGAALVVTKRK